MNGLHPARRLRNFLRRDPFIKWWLLPAWVGIGLASLVIALVSFRRIAPHLGHFRGLEQHMPATTLAQQERAEVIGITVRLAARFSPWRADCYPQAIVARFLLGLYDIPFTLSMGVKRNVDTGALQAHAWVRSGNAFVTGGDGNAKYSTVAVFSGKER
jgi:hypothetical protein